MKSSDPTPLNDRRADADIGGAAPVTIDWPLGRCFDGFCSVLAATKSLRVADLRQHKEARLYALKGAHRDGLKCNRKSKRADAASRTWRDSSKHSFALLWQVPKDCTRDWRKKLKWSAVRKRTE